MAFSRQEYRSGLPSPPTEDLPDPGIELRSPTLQAGSLQSEPQGSPLVYLLHRNLQEFQELCARNQDKAKDVFLLLLLLFCFVFIYFLLVGG